ncbi:MAG: DinB family protein [bacterium]
MTQRPTAPSGRPLPGEYAPYAQSDIDSVVGTDASAVLTAMAVDTRGLLASLSEDQVGGLRYAPEKWTLKEVLGHIIDDERIFAHRAFCLARGESLPLPGFDEKVYAANSEAEVRPWADLLEEYQVVRAASVALFRSLLPAAWGRAGEVNGYRATPRGLAFHIAGHELHHLRMVRARYLPLLEPPLAPPPN